MIGSLMFFEAESVEEVRKIVEADIYYTSNVVRLCFPQFHSPIDLTFRPVGQGKDLYFTFYAGGALAVELDRMPVAATVITIEPMTLRPQFHHFFKQRCYLA